MRGFFCKARARGGCFACKARACEGRTKGAQLKSLLAKQEYMADIFARKIRVRGGYICLQGETDYVRYVKEVALKRQTCYYR